MPYRIDLHDLGDEALDRLVELGALDVERPDDRSLAALMPDRVAPEDVCRALGIAAVASSPAAGRDADSVWVLHPRPIQVGRLRIVPAHLAADPDALRLVDGPAFGTGLHPTTALCLELIAEAADILPPDSVLDVGTGSGVLALAALRLGVTRALGIDIDDEAIRVASANARLNGFADRLQLMRGGPDALGGTWPLVLANVLAAPLIEMAPAVARRVGRRGQLILSGIACAVQPDVEDAYARLGMRRAAVRCRAGWVALVLQASW
jgi:ribosomal protein L11 methyltransferase